MFTGLVQTVGHLRRHSRGVVVVAPDLGGLALGDSVAVDGVCLTVAALTGDGFRADVSEETLGRSTLAAKADAGGAVNLEPALRLADRLGGHLVSGHVDGPGEVTGISRTAGSWRLDLRWLDAAYGRYVCEKASVAVDGISLTVAGCDSSGERFWIAVIPHTWAGTTLRQRRVGERVNLEADLLAKYTERLLAAGIGGGPAGAGGLAGSSHRGGPGVDTAWLTEHGWG